MILWEDGNVAFALAERGDVFERGGVAYKVEGMGVVTLNGETVQSVVLGFACARCTHWTVVPWRAGEHSMYLPKLCRGCVGGTRAGLNLRYALAGHSFALDGYGYLVRRVVSGEDGERLVIASTCRVCEEPHEMTVGRSVRSERLRAPCAACVRAKRRGVAQAARARKAVRAAERAALRAESAPVAVKPVTRCAVPVGEDGYAWSWADGGGLARHGYAAAMAEVI